MTLIHHQLPERGGLYLDTNKSAMVVKLIAPNPCVARQISLLDQEIRPTLTGG